MFTKGEISKIVEQYIENAHGSGDQKGAGGHLSHVDFQINDISEVTNTQQGWELEFEYTIFITTEFTYYPDNPPYEYNYKKKIVLNGQGEVIAEEELKSSGEGGDIEIPGPPVI